jgi:hypothetical protein
MADIPQPASIITGANLRPRPEDEDLGDLMAQVLANHAEKQGQPPPSPEETQELLGLLTGLPHEEEPPAQDKAPPPRSPAKGASDGAVPA